MKKYPTNEERTLEYLSNFNREKTIKKLINKKDPIIFDVGANDGISLLEFSSLWHESVVHCFEPQEECWPLLKDRMISVEEKNNNPTEHRVLINKIAVGDKSEQNVTFYSHRASSGLSGFNKINVQSMDSISLNKIRDSENKDKFEQYCEEVNNERLVDIVRLDDYMADKGIEHIDLLKIDTQGHEPEVLSGLGEKLADVDVVVTELMLYDYYERSLSFSDIEKYLLPAGFQLYDISHISKNPMNGRTDWVDVIYVNKKLGIR
jgi:FkbM family methyltransferase